MINFLHVNSKLNVKKKLKIKRQLNLFMKVLN